MTGVSTKFDPESLLENVEGSIITTLKEELNDSGGWEKLAILCVNTQGKKVFSQKDLLNFSQKKSASEAFVDELIRRNVTMKYLISLLQKAEMNEILNALGNEETVTIESQSMNGLVYVNRGKEVTISIKASGIPAPSFLWYKGELPLTDETSHQFHLNSFNAKDEGIYLCLIRQTLREREVILWSSPVQLCIQEIIPAFTQHPESTELTEGEKLYLVCEAEGYPEPTYTWIKDGEPVVRGSNDPWIEIENVQLRDGGKYSCVVKNSLGEAESSVASVQVNPRGKSSLTPEVILQPVMYEERPERSIGQSFSLVCSARCSRNLTFEWMVNGTRLEGKQSNHHMIMNSSSPPDFSSSLLYTVNESDGSSVKVLCIVKSADASQCSGEVKIKVVAKDGDVHHYAGTKWALLIANTDYKVGPLPPLFTPVADMEKIAKELSQMDFHCLLLTNLNLLELKNAVKVFASLIGPGDYVTFCFAGHGLFGGVDLLMPIPDHNSTTELETLSSVWVRVMLQKNDPALLFIVLDMCRHIHYPHDERPENMVKQPTKRNYVILNATTEGYQSLEDPKKSSVLTGSLVKHLKDNVDVVTMARSVLRDVAHMSPYVRREQIPNLVVSLPDNQLEVNLCDSRSLLDAQKMIDAEKEKKWSTLNELPQTRTTKIPIDGREIVVKVSCSFGGEFRLVSNVIHLQVDLMCDGPAPPMALALNVRHNVDQIHKGNNQVIYAIKAIHKLEIPLTLTLGFQDRSKRVFEEKFQLGLPGIAKVKINSNSFDDGSLRAKNASYNIP